MAGVLATGMVAGQGITRSQIGMDAEAFSNLKVNAMQT